MFLSSINLLSLLVGKENFEFSLVIHTYTQKENNKKKETRNEKELRTEHVPGNSVIQNPSLPIFQFLCNRVPRYLPQNTLLPELIMKKEDSGLSNIHPNSPFYLNHSFASYPGITQYPEACSPKNTFFLQLFHDPYCSQYFYYC